jgi:hypothetical protein
VVMGVSRPRRASRVGRTAPARSAGVVVVLGAAAVAGLAGLLLLLGAVAPPRPAPAVPAGTLIAGDLSLQVQTSGWITHDDVGGPTPAALQNGFAMPASMMPGMPDHGTHRLYLEAVVSDGGQASASYAPGDFSVQTPGGGREWPLDQPASFGPGTLAPGQTRSLDLLFDVPDTIAKLDTSSRSPEPGCGASSASTPPLSRTWSRCDLI